MDSKAKSKAQQPPEHSDNPEPATTKAADKVPYSYVTEGGEKYHVVAVSYKNSTRVETGTITFGNGDRYEGDWSGGAKNGRGKYTCKKWCVL